MLTLALALTGCGGGDKGGDVATAGGTPSAGASLSNQDKALQYVACVRNQGIEIGDPENGVVPPIEQGTVSETGLKAALDKCRQYLPTNGKSTTVTADQLAKLREFAKCMRDNGVKDFPDPDPDEGGISIDPNSVNPNDPTFKGAQEKCNQIAAPSSTPAGGTGGGQEAN